MKIDKIFKQKDSFLNKKIQVQGWIRFKRKSKKIIFLTVFDGTNLNGIQVVVKHENLEEFQKVKDLPLFSAIDFEGFLIAGKVDLEISLTKILTIYKSLDDYVLGKKEHGLEFLRENAHLRPRTKLFQSIMKIRSNLAILIHEFFSKHNFIYFHAPIITENDAEGAGESFYLKTQDNKTFFSNQGTLTVSGQLHAESYAQAFGDVYTFGPTFRAENSNTSRHAAEFWMIEPESAFRDLNDMMKLSEDLLKFLAKKILEKSKEELIFLEKFYKTDLINRLNNLILKEFKRITYQEAIDILISAKNKGHKFVENNIKFGIDLSTEHEKYLSSKHFKGPVFVYNYPIEIKSFYMYRNKDEKTVRGYDLLVPEIGELIGGSQREDNFEKLMKQTIEKGINPQDLKWYIDMRKYGYAKSTGFGIGFERLIMYFTGVDNIRDVIPFPRTPGKLRY